MALVTYAAGSLQGVGLTTTVGSISKQSIWDTRTRCKAFRRGHISVGGVVQCWIHIMPL
jgi:hypothetical protein